MFLFSVLSVKGKSAAQVFLKVGLRIPRREGFSKKHMSKYRGDNHTEGNRRNQPCGATEKGKEMGTKENRHVNNE